ncbi:hypothetical protein A0R60_4406 [Enterobacter asburiae]|nr:hypothetical protein A0R60_4406 [Enterobacter asburiae]
MQRNQQIVTISREVGDARSLDMKLNDRGMAQRNLCAFRGRFHASKF